MNWIKAILLFLFVLLLSDGCVDRLQVELQQRSNLPIAITGFISNQPGPYEIRVRRSFPIGGTDRYEAPVSAKEVTIIDNEGNNELLKEKSPGLYSTEESFRGVVGKSYRLRVEFFDGKTYESVSDTIAPLTRHTP
ncbi:MAG: DUF4249 family protein [Bacteroidetes bacterium]|nr:DUF4249 family protein [Bacteroidota bacterium]